MAPLSEQTSMLMNTNSGLNGPDLSSLDMQRNTGRMKERRRRNKQKTKWKRETTERKTGRKH